MAKRSCRRTEEEAAIHKRAVELRKMTDAQLVKHIEDMVEKARNEGKPDFNLVEFIEGIGKLPGIGKATMEKIRGYAQEGGWIG